ncbi:MAG TPA: protein kinase [Gemmatimonadaceae bacterium]|nr:protein kinase [Gemmatimonadaceae bacterium]
MTDHLREQLQATLGAGYTLGRELGGGGMSRVFIADEHRLNRKVVVKVLSPELAQGISVERFDREIQTAAALQQANIVPVLTAGETDGLPFYTMPFVEGESLRARLGRGPLSITEVIGVLRDVSKALAYAHRQGVVHRDIKPDNVLLSEGTAVVTDFGIAKAINAARTGPGRATLTQIGTSIGTPAYMAPEQAAGDPEVDHRSDIYSLGAMAYELITGQAVFAGRTPQRMMAAHMSEEAAPITSLRPQLPPALAELVMNSLSKDPASRPQSAAEVTQLLDTITSGGSMQAMPAVLIGGAGMFRKALLVYAVAFIAVAIIARAAIVGIGLPDWVFPGSLIVMALGLPVILWTAYVQHVTRRAMAATPTYTPGGTPSAASHGTMATLALKAAPHVTWHRAARGGLYAMGIFVLMIGMFMGMRSLGIGPFGSLSATGQLNRRDQLIIADFRTTNTDSTLGRVVSDAVRSGLSSSRAFTLVSPGAVVGALRRMQRVPTTRVDSGMARQIALRDGIKAIVDGEVTGVGDGYIVSLRLVRADLGTEIASFRESGEGPRGLIDAADKLSRALRSKAGESLRDVNATPPLAQMTTASLAALRKASEAGRANAVGDRRAIQLAREAVAIDSTFATAWSGLGAFLSNYGESRSAVDSALTQAFRYSDRLPDVERQLIIARYYSTGPGRDRARAIAAYQQVLQAGDTTPGILVNLGESVRTRRQYAQAESLNLASFRRDPSGTALGNITEMQINQGRLDDALRTAEQLIGISRNYGNGERLRTLWSRREFGAVTALVDTIERTRSVNGQTQRIRQSMALLQGRIRDFRRHSSYLGGDTANAPPARTAIERWARDEQVHEVGFEIAALGPSAALTARLDSAIARVPFSELPEVDRPYFDAAWALALAGHPAKARAMIARYQQEVRDTALRRADEPDLHTITGIIAAAEGNFTTALAETRQGDIGGDGLPAHECAPCLPWNLARIFDAAGQRDSAIVMYERYLSTPFWEKIFAPMDPVRMPFIHERLGQLYEAAGNTTKSAEHYRAFIELWKNADPELRPRVAIAREKLRRMSLDAPR